MKKIIVVLFLSIAAAALFGCGLFNDQNDKPDKSEGTFEIYLLPAEFYQEVKDEHLTCASEEGPLLSNQDIQSYDIETHEIMLNQATFEGLSQIQLAGQPFLICADKEPIYTGEFMALFMSRSSEEVVILWPSMEIDKPVIHIQLGYPGPDFFTGEDPRSDARIVRALEQAGLITNNLDK